MVTYTLRPASNSSTYNAFTTLVPAGGNKWEKVDEAVADDADYVGGSADQTQCFLTSSTDANNVPSNAVIQKITVKYRGRNVLSGTRNFQSIIRLSSTDATGATHSSNAFALYSDDFVTKPAGGSWAQTDLASLEFGMKIGSELGARQLSQIYVEVVTVDNHPTPTGLEVDRSSSQTNASETPLFTAVFQATGDSGTATHAYIQVSANADYSSPVWDSGWIDIADITDNVRCAEIEYAGTALASGVTYYWRIKFKDGSAVESNYGTGTFSGINRSWALAGYAYREKILWNTPHQAIPSGYQQEFTFQTGLREIIGTNGHFNESVQSSGGFQIEYFNGKTHIVWLGKSTSYENSQVFIRTYDHFTEAWGSVVRVADALSPYDTHFFPSMCIDAQGYIHIFYGCHYTPLYYVRSSVANVSGSLPGETTSYTTPAAITSSGPATYPIGFAIPDADRIYVLYRVGSGVGASYTWALRYSTNNGTNWSAAFTFVNDTTAYKYFAYVYGIRFDLTRNRLHISGTFNHAGTIDLANNNTERGIWHAYSDYGDTVANAAGCGFDIWRKHDGSVVGYTEANTIPGTAIDFVAANHIEMSYAGGYGTDNLSKIFTTNMVLDRLGQPIVLVGQKFYDLPVVDSSENPQVDCFITGYKYSEDIGTGGGTWQKIYIGDQVNLMARLQRCSVGVQTDREGVIHMVMPVNGKTWHWLKPTADVGSTNVTRSAGANNYALLDDGLAICDGDGTYIDLNNVAGTDGNATFTSTDALPAGADIIQVEVYAVVKRASGTDATYLLEISDGGTVAQSGAKTATSAWKEGLHVWTTNPFTSAAWVAADFAGLEFGISVSSAAVARVSKCYLRIYYTLAADRDIFATELWELVSLDDGLTWSRRELSRNSYIGIPILSASHHLNNDQVQIIWCSGSDIFYLTDQAYGRVQKTGRDLRMVYAGSEIDRLIDYPNLTSTRITFKTQAAISADAVAGANDYYLYHGNPNESTDPKADPAQVLILNEGFEDFSDGADPDGVGGWTVTTGTAAAWQSPPQGNNKIYAGNVSMGLTGVMDKTVGSALTDVMIRGAFWHEGAGLDPTQIILVDASSNVVGVGIDPITERDDALFCYNLLATVYTAATIKTPARNWWRFSLQVTSRGCSFWINDVLVFRELTAITTVDKLRLSAPAGSYFDALELLTRVAKTISTTRTTGLTPDNTLTYNPSGTTAYNATYDALVATTGQMIHKLIVNLEITSVTDTATANFKIYICPSGTYDENNIERTVDLSIVVTQLGVATAGAATINNLTNTPKTIKIDFFNWSAANPTDTAVTLVSIVEEDLKPEPTVTLQATEYHGFGIGATLQGKGQHQMLVGAYISGTQVLVDRAIPVDARRQLTRTAILPLTTQIELSSMRSLPLNALGLLSATRSMAVDLRAVAAVEGILRIGSLTTQDVTRQLPMVFAGTISGERGIPVDFRLVMAADQTLPVDTRRINEGGATLQIAYDGEISIDRTLAIESETTLSRETSLPVAMRRGTSAEISIPIASLNATSAGIALAISFEGEKAVVRELPVASTRDLTVVRSVPVSSLKTSQASIAIPISSFAGASMGGTVVIEFRQELLLVKSLPIAFGGAIAVEVVRNLPVAFTTTLEADRTVAVDTRLTIDGDRSLPVGSERMVAAERDLSIDWSRMIDVRTGLPISSQTGASVSVSVPIGYLGQAEADIAVAIEFHGGVAVARQIPLSWTRELATLRSLPISSGTASQTSLSIPIATLSAAQATGILAIEFRKQLAVVKSLPVYFSGGATVEFLRSLPIAFTTALQIDRSLPAGSLTQAKIDRSLPVQYFEEAGGDRRLAAEFRQAIEVLRSLPVEFRAGVTVEASRALPVSYHRTIEAAVKLMTDWTKQVDARIHLNVDYQRAASATAQLTIEFRSGVSLVSRALPVATLMQLIASRSLPIFVAGVLFTDCLIRDCRLLMPALGDVRLLPPEIDEVALFQAQLAGAVVYTPEIIDALLHISALADAKLAGGNP